MIKKFEEYIAEGMWKSGLNRAKNNTPRQEDRINSNVYNLEALDLGLPFLVANRLLEVDDEQTFCYGDFEISNEYKEIQKNGWRLPTIDQLDFLMNNTEQTYREDVPGRIVFVISNHKGKIVFALPKINDVDCRLFTQIEHPANPKVDIITLDPDDDSNKLSAIHSSIPRFFRGYILLIKDKK